MPSLSVAPIGMLPIKSEESVLSPFAEAVIFNGIGVFSTPSTETADTLGASGSTITSSVVLAVLVCPSASFDVAVMLRVKLASLVVLIVRVERFQPMISTDVEPDCTVKLWVPSLSVAPIGMSPTNSEESVLSPLAEAMIFNAIGVPSTPSTDTAETLGASGSTITSSLVLAVLVWPSRSVAVAVTLRVKFVSLAALIVRVERFQPMMSTDVEPDCAVKLWAPSLSVAPIGMLPIKSEESVLSPVAELVIVNGIAVPSTPSIETADTLGASGSTTTSSVVLAVLVCPSLSADVAVTLRVKFASLAVLIVRVERFHPMTPTDVLPDWAVKL